MTADIGNARFASPRLIRASTPEIRQRRRDFIDELKRHVPVHAVTDETGELIGKISGEQAALGVRLPFDDLAIGASALEQGYGVATLNTHPFEMVPDLVVAALRKIKEQSAYAMGRLVAVQHPLFMPGAAGIQFNEITATPSPANSMERGCKSTKTPPYPWATQTQNLDAAYTYDTEGKTSGGAGGGIFVTNAGNSVALRGTFTTATVGLPGGFGVQFDYANGIAVLSVTWGMSTGLPVGLSVFQTNTFWPSGTPCP